MSQITNFGGSGGSLVTPVSVPNGGTGIASITDHALIVGSGVADVTVLAAATNGQIPIGSTGADPTIGNITSSGGTITITNGAGTINMETAGGIPGSFPTDSGTATPAAGVLNILGGDGIATSGASNNVTVAAAGSLLVASGFESWGGAGAYYDDTTIGDFTVSRPGTGYILGSPVAWTAPQTVTGLTAGNTYYIYVDSAGTLQKTTSYSESLFQNNIVLFECMRDSTSGTNVQLTVKENHPYEFPWKTSVWAHDTLGPVISDMQGGANITLNGTQKIEISGADALEDHGLETTIPDSGGVAEVFEQYFTNGSGKWARHAQSDTFDGTWDNAGTPTAIGTNKYTVYRLYVSKDDLTSATPTYFAVLGDAEYNNLAQADTAIANDAIPTATGELAMLELAQLGYIVFEESSTSIVQVVIAKETARTSFSGLTATTASLVLTDTTNFDGILSAADTNVQSALETIDDWGKTASRSFASDSGSAVPASEVITIAGGDNIGTSAAGSTVTIAVSSAVCDSAATDSGTATPAAGVLTIAGGTNVTTSGAGSTVTINSSGGGGISWNEETSTSVTMAVDNGYIASNAAQVTCTLPATAALGSVFRVAGKGAGGWKVGQQAGQTITWDEASATTTGVGGSLASTDDYDAVELVCITANTDFSVISSKGNISIT